MGHKKPEGVYWNPNWASRDIGTFVGRGRGENGLLTGMVLKSCEASWVDEMPEQYQGEPRYTLYLVLVGDDPPLWFSWREVQELLESDD
jgi:hypothetical protein